MKLYCSYSSGKDIADHKCDLCGKLMCKMCGYDEKGKDYCNDCWIETGSEENPSPEEVFGKEKITI